MRDVDHRELLASFAGSKGLTMRPDPPASTYTAFDRPRPLTDWAHDGQVDKGHEASGLVLRFDVIEAMNEAARTGLPCEFVVIGERRFTDGRFFLDQAINPRYVEATTDNRYHDGRWVYVCPDCGGRGEAHNKVSVESPARPGHNILAKCPRDTSRARR